MQSGVRSQVQRWSSWPSVCACLTPNKMLSCSYLLGFPSCWSKAQTYTTRVPIFQPTSAFFKSYQFSVYFSTIIGLPLASKISSYQKPSTLMFYWSLAKNWTKVLWTKHFYQIEAKCAYPQVSKCYKDWKRTRWTLQDQETRQAEPFLSTKVLGPSGTQKRCYFGSNCGRRFHAGLLCRELGISQLTNCQSFISAFFLRPYSCNSVWPSR